MKLINNRFYFDFNATSPLDERVITHLQAGDFPFANPASLHSSGREARKAIQDVSSYLLNLFQLQSTHEVLFHSGASEGINAFFKGVAFDAFKNKKKLSFIFSSVDHAAVFQLESYLKTLGHDVYFFTPDSNGDLASLKWKELDELLEKIYLSQSEDSIYMNWTWVNNETGVVWSLDEVLKLKTKYKCFVHVDAVQSVGKIRHWNILLQELDAYTYSAHKFGALKGIGFTLLHKSCPWFPLIHGGSQQDGKRAGTENALSVQSIKWALTHFEESFNYDELEKAKKTIEDSLLTLVKEKGEIIAHRSLSRNANTIFLLVRGVKAEVLQAAFDMSGVELSTGSACSSGVIKENRVLMSMGHTAEESRQALRFSFSPFMTQSDAIKFVEKITSVLKKFV
ncbi:MAG: aminotransferase class V-fold PLP-dependent enzyme [Bacteriovoracaceae bacterium]|nr:aminotransferase class V-fold PLP-dependent enzyme [Bacteriovoracaceae bacterium]